ncbi:PRC-barrel domain-containing protein [Candidatus Woesearchaeota archaeon]|nr:PRC-barrel domain-containing protein [Candidatus Woesearchaeota archaeon]
MLVKRIVKLKGDMMLKTKKVTDVFGLRVFTDEGYYYGEIEEVVLQGNRVWGWRIKATKNSQLFRVLTGAKGATIPHQLVRSIGDIIIISKNALPSEEMAVEEQTVEEY